MANGLPDRPDTTKLPAERTLTQEQFEMVIRRAAEMQARAAEEPGVGALTETEAIRIGREIGISPSHLRRALAETSGVAAPPPSTAVKLLGPAWVRASRTVPGSASGVRDQLDQYLVQRERLAPVRRFPDRTTYARARGNELQRVVQLARETLMSRKQQPLVGAGFRLRQAREVESTVQPLEEGFSYVTLGVDLGNVRAGMAAGGASVGGAIALGTAVVLGIAVDPAAALLGLPALPGAMWGTRMIQIKTAAHAQTHLESILDCLERGEPLVLPRY